MNKKKIISVVLLTLAALFMVLAIVGAAMSCNHALILIAPAIMLAVYPTINFVKSLKNKFAVNK